MVAAVMRGRGAPVAVRSNIDSYIKQQLGVDDYELIQVHTKLKGTRAWG